MAVAGTAGRSVFGPVLEHLHHLPTVFSKQFLTNSGQSRSVLLVGTMERVRHRPAWLAPVLWLLRFAGGPFPETGRNVPFTVAIREGPSQTGHPARCGGAPSNFGAGDNSTARWRLIRSGNALSSISGPVDGSRLFASSSSFRLVPSR